MSTMIKVSYCLCIVNYSGSIGKWQQKKLQINLLAKGSFLLKIDSKLSNSCHDRERLIANSGKVITLDNIHKTLAKAAEKALCFITHELDGYNRRLQVTTDTCLWKEIMLLRTVYIREAIALTTTHLIL
jgi:hypothetical protein